MSIPKVKIAVLKNLLIFGEKYLPQSVRLLEGGGVETLFGRIPLEHPLCFAGASLRMLNIGTLKPQVKDRVSSTSPLLTSKHQYVIDYLAQSAGFFKDCRLKTPTRTHIVQERAL